MRAMPDEADRLPANSRRQEVERKVAVIEMKARTLANRHGRLAVGLALTAVAAFGLGMMFYRRTQRNSVVRRVHSAIPDSVWDLPEELVAQIKKPLQRATKAL